MRRQGERGGPPLIPRSSSGSRPLRELLSFGIVVSACANQPSPPPAVSPIPITLRVAPADLGCDAIAAPYRSITFRIDATAPEQVVALTNTGASLSTFWSAGFVGGSSADPVVRDPSGSVVARDGEVLPIPEAARPRLAGYFICPSSNALYVLFVDPQ